MNKIKTLTLTDRVETLEEKIENLDDILDVVTKHLDVQVDILSTEITQAVRGHKEVTDLQSMLQGICVDLESNIGNMESRVVAVLKELSGE